MLEFLSVKVTIYYKGGVAVMRMQYASSKISPLAVGDGPQDQAAPARH